MLSWNANSEQITCEKLFLCCSVRPLCQSIGQCLVKSCQSGNLKLAGPNVWQIFSFCSAIFIWQKLSKIAQLCFTGQMVNTCKLKVKVLDIGLGFMYFGILSGNYGKSIVLWLTNALIVAVCCMISLHLYNIPKYNIKLLEISCTIQEVFLFVLVQHVIVNEIDLLIF